MKRKTDAYIDYLIELPSKGSDVCHLLNRYFLTDLNDDQIIEESNQLNSALSFIKFTKSSVIDTLLKQQI